MNSFIMLKTKLTGLKKTISKSVQGREFLTFLHLPGGRTGGQTGIEAEKCDLIKSAANV